ncbi:MAG: patatin-like phospholipase family protein [Bacteroidota bacterium]
MNSYAATEKTALNALVVEGGAMRGIFSTGILDAFLENHFNPFQIAVGVSAGATNIASYLAEMFQRNYKVYTDYSARPDFINWLKFIKGGHLVDLDWLWGLTIKEIRLDLDKIINSKTQFYVGVTQVDTGEPVFFKPAKDNLEEVLKASSAIPVFYRGFVRLNETNYVDGGLVDPIPVYEAYRRGARKIMVLRSRPQSYTMKANSQLLLMSKLYLKEYPNLIKAIRNRPDKYHQAVAFMRHPPEGVQIIEVNPPEAFQTKRLTKDVTVLKQDYHTGYEIGLKIMDQWNIG